MITKEKIQQRKQEWNEREYVQAAYLSTSIEIV